MQHLHRHGRIDVELAQDVGHEGGHHGDHHAGVDPVEQVGRPAGGELGHAGEPPVAGLFPVQERLLGEVVGPARAGLRIAPGQFRERQGGEEGHHQGRDDAGPHVGVAAGVGGLDLHGDPQERARARSGPWR